MVLEVPCGDGIKLEPPTCKACAHQPVEPSLWSKIKPFLGALGWDVDLGHTCLCTGLIPDSVLRDQMRPALKTIWGV